MLPTSNVLICRDATKNNTNYNNNNNWNYSGAKAPPCSSWDTGRVVPLIYSPGVKSLN